MSMPERKVTVGSSDGLHARTARLFVEAAARQPAEVRISAGSKPPAPATSILSVLSLGAVHGTEVTLTAEGAGAEESLDALADLLTQDLDNAAEEASDA
jgi:phosphocarrier protein HPr